jgi:hypothetical protein
MPDFLVIGVAKAGTTSLYHYLAEHPQIHMSPVKEPNFFQFGEPEQEPALGFVPRQRVVSTLPAYQALFAGASEGRICGEASPSNFEVRACCRINHYLPNSRFICILRQPIERAYSEFAMHSRHGWELEPDFRTAYLDTPRRLQQPFEERLPAYASRDAGWYVSRLEDWFERFRRHQFSVGLYEDLKADPMTYVQAQYGFLGVDDSYAPDVTQIHNQGTGIRCSRLNRFIRANGLLKRWLRLGIPPLPRKAIVRWLLEVNRTSLAPLDSELRRELTAPQRDSILRLQDLIHRDLTCWLG